MFKEQYQKLNEEINPSEKLICAASNNAGAKRVRGKLGKPAIVIASVCICGALAMPALAAVEPIYQLMYMVSPAVAQFFMPVQKADEANGIEMNVVSAYIHGSVAEIYVTMRDLEQNRVDETTDLFDSYTINRPFSSTAHCERVGYDESTKMATFLITIEEWGKSDIVGDKITFTAREFISQKTEQEDVKIDLNLADFGAEEQSQKRQPNGGSSTNADFKLPEEYGFLVPKSAIYKITNHLSISNIGFVDGKLHVQMSVSEKLKLDPHGGFYLLDSDGNKITTAYTMSYRDNSATYDEFIFDVAQEDLEDYTLHGSFYEAGLNTKGPWQVTFPLENMK